MTTKNDLSLYAITEEMSAFEEILEMDQGEFNEESESLLASITDSLTLKTDSVVGYINREEDLVLIAKNRIKELRDFISSKENKIDRFKDYTKTCLERTGMTEFKGVLNTIKLRKPSKVVQIQDEKEIPPQYFKSETVTTIDKKQLKSDLKEGQIIDGVALIDGKTSLVLGLRKGK